MNYGGSYGDFFILQKKSDHGDLFYFVKYKGFLCSKTRPFLNTSTQFSKGRFFIAFSVTKPRSLFYIQ